MEVAFVWSDNVRVHSRHGQVLILPSNLARNQCPVTQNSSTEPRWVVGHGWG